MTGNGTLQLPPQASTVAHQVDSLYYFIFWGSVFFFVLIVGLSTIFVLRYRRRAGQKLEPSTSHNTPLELAWTLIPLALVIVVFVWGFRGYMTLAVAPGNSLQYNVTGKKWLWEVTHPNGNVAVNEMTVPVGQPVKVTLRSEDVIHSFYIPAFRVKQDALPNRYTTLWFEATLPGDYDLFCAEYCGTGHSEMLGKVHVLPATDFQKWLEAGSGPGPGMSLAQWGEQLYKSKACITCHSIDGSVKTGPSFQGIFGHSVDLADGITVTADENYIRQSILDPGSQVVKGFQPVMPTYAGTLKPQDIDGLIEYIKSLK
jgi:cytochrome c oxidase subunit 2